MAIISSSFNPSASYNYPGVWGSKPQQSFQGPLGVIAANDFLFFSTSCIAISSTLILSATHVANFPNFTISIINNSGTFQNGSVQYSPDNINWETISSSFGAVASGTMVSLQVINNSRRYVRCVTTGSNAAVVCHIHMNGA
jgi:hypothetical protein